MLYPQERKMDSKKCYVLFCDKKYFYLMRNALTLLEKFSNHKVLAYTVNFLPTEPFKNVVWKRVDDQNLLEYESTGKNHLIKNEWDKTMYSCFLKASAVCESLDTDFDEFVYLDVDTFPLKNVDDIFILGESKNHTCPILPRYNWEYMMYGGKGSPFTDGGYDESQTLEWWLLNELGLTDGGHERHWYRSSCFFYYNKKSKPIWEEASSISSDENIIKNQDKFFTDESIINVLLWKHRCADFFENSSVIHISNGDQLDSTSKIDQFFDDLKSSKSGPPLVTNWNGSSQCQEAWMFHGKISKFFWKENILSGDRVYSESLARTLNDYFVYKSVSIQ